MPVFGLSYPLFVLRKGGSIVWPGLFLLYHTFFLWMNSLDRGGNGVY